jgi:hypothetical protein
MNEIHLDILTDLHVLNSPPNTKSEVWNAICLICLSACMVGRIFLMRYLFMYQVWIPGGYEVPSFRKWRPSCGPPKRNNCLIKNVPNDFD